ncbi:MAG: hypothetical protein WC127_04125 [Acidaminococcaceae bacterium]
MKMEVQKTNIENPFISVSLKVKKIFPKVLIDYLCQLLRTDLAISGSWHAFRLCKNQLGGNELQDIFHTGENKLSLKHRIFGCKPVDAEIIVKCDGTGYHMSLINERPNPASVVTPFWGRTIIYNRPWSLGL